ncbi:unnamed protein product [Thlaspi arvense]|uniref:Uncharacterized protein n=1 Tax=Thlaspi arvense TaxID=13288 RepID=A0AAU9S018_THLAR|nr:unnamed protein product [Thlaspi arvense]
MNSFDGTKSIKDGNDAEPIQSSPVKWKGTSMSWQDKPLDCNEKCDNNSRESRVTRNSCEDSQQCETGRSYESERMGASSSHEDGDPGSGRSTSSSEIFEDATDRHNIEKYMPYLTEESSFVYPELYECLVSSLPNIVKGCQWHFFPMKGSTIKHGISLRTLIRRSADLPGPCLLIVGDKQGGRGVWWTTTIPSKTYSEAEVPRTNQTFVFTNIYGGPRLFRPLTARIKYRDMIDKEMREAEERNTSVIDIVGVRDEMRCEKQYKRESGRGQTREEKRWEKLREKTCQVVAGSTRVSWHCQTVEFLETRVWGSLHPSIIDVDPLPSMSDYEGTDLVGGLTYTLLSLIKEHFTFLYSEAYLFCTLQIHFRGAYLKHLDETLKLLAAPANVLNLAPYACF